MYRVLVMYFIDLMLLLINLQVMLLTWHLLLRVHLPLGHQHSQCLELHQYGSWQMRATWVEGAVVLLLFLQLEGSPCFHRLPHPQVSLSD